MKQAALFGDVGRDVGCFGDRVFVADDGAKLSDQFGRERSGCGLNDIHLKSLAPNCSLALLYSRPIAARRSRSLIASPSP